MDGPAEQIDRSSPQRLLGTYPQRQEGLLMQRIPLMGGRITSSQWLSIVAIARRFTHETPLHLTTRQDIELHNIALADIGAVYEQLRLAGFDTYGACGDCVRNITACPGYEFHPGAVDILPLAEKVREVLFACPALSNLPRKFKISFSGCGNACGRPFINDLGFIARADGSFHAIGAGSLGARPQPGIELYPSLSGSEVIWLAAAALEMFAELGDRENRRKARLRHVRQRLGDDEFRKQLHERFERKKQTPAAQVQCVKIKESRPYQATLQCITGRMTLADVEFLVGFCEQSNIRTRINLTHGIEMFSDKPIQLPPTLKRYENLPCIVACPGNDTCSHGLTATRQLAAQLADKLDSEKWTNKVIAISGCSNHCAQSAVADVGLCGCVKTIDSQRQEAYQLYTGGGCGKNNKLANAVEIISAEQIPQKMDLIPDF
jgi:sulfite reductase (NADPH) hemoprotein beta-component